MKTLVPSGRKDEKGEDIMEEVIEYCSKTGEVYRFREFDLKHQMNHKLHCVVSGATQTGKTFFMTNLIYHRRKKSRWVVVNGSEKRTKYYQKFVPAGFVHDDGEKIPDIAKRIVETQDKIFDKLSEEESEKLLESGDASVCFVIDDCFETMHLWNNNKDLINLVTSGRHADMSLILGTQCVSEGMKTWMKANMKYAVTTRQSDISEAEKFNTYFAGMIPKRDYFGIMNVLTEDYQVMVIDRTSRSTKMEDKVFWYKAFDALVDENGDPEYFKVGSDKFWEYHDKHYVKDVKKVKEDKKTLMLKNQDKKNVVYLTDSDSE